MFKKQILNVFTMEEMCMHGVKRDIIEEVVKHKILCPLSQCPCSEANAVNNLCLQVSIMILNEVMILLHVLIF